MLGSYDIIVKTEEIRRRVQEGDYETAQKVIDTMKLKKVKNIADLSLLAEVLTQNKRYDEAMELLNRVYKKSKTRRTLYQMVYVSIGRKNIQDAEHYFNKYKETAPNDYSIYIFRYKIDKLKKEPYEVLINSLKELKKKTYIEKWAYELAKMYYKAGMEKECIKECSDIILWFGEGSYVEKAKILKAYYSGEVNKDEIIENLKKKASKNYKGEEAEPSLEESEVKPSQDKTETESSLEKLELEPSPDELSLDKEQIPVNTMSDIMVNDQVMEEIKDSVSKDIGDILSNEENDIVDFEDDTDTIPILIPEDNNEDLDKLIKLSEDLGVDIVQIFGNFLHIKSIQNQLIKSIELITNKRTKSVQMIITGAPSSGKTTLAKDIAIFLKKIGKLQSSRIAKVSALRLNETFAIKNKDELKGCCMVIENANELKQPTINKILALIKYFHGDIGIILEENKKNMNKLFREEPKLMEMFKNRIHLPQYTEEELLGFAHSYIILKSYSLEPLTLNVLNEGVNEIIKNTSKDKQLESILKYVHNAISFADIRTGKQLSKLGQDEHIESEILPLLAEDFTMNITA